MKILIALLLFSSTAYAQIDKAIDDKFEAFSKNLDSIVVKEKKDMTGTFNIDSIVVPNGETNCFTLRLIGTQMNIVSGVQTMKVSIGVVKVYVSNNNGNHMVQTNTERAFSGMFAGATFTVIPGQKYAIVQVIGNNTKTTWNYKKTTL